MPLLVSPWRIASVFGTVKIGGVRLVNDECIACGKCNRVCDMQVDVMGDLNTHGEVRNSDCILCLKCTDVCPTDLIALSMRRFDASLSTDASARAEKSTLKRRKLSAFDVIIAVIWIGVSVFFFFSDVRAYSPQEVKVLMSVGLLIIVYGVVWLGQKSWNKVTTR